MASYKNNGLMIYKEGNKYILYPNHKKECVEGMEEIDAHLVNTENPHSMTDEQVAYLDGATVADFLAEVSDAAEEEKTLPKAKFPHTRAVHPT